MKSSWKTWLALAGIFLSGAVAGGFTALRFVKPPLPPPPPPGQGDSLAPQSVRRFLEKLDLTSEQKARITPILKRATDELGLHRREAFRVMERMNAEVTQTLDDKQRTRFVEMQERERERRKKIMEERARQHGEGRKPEDGRGPRRDEGGPRREDEPPGERPPGDRPPPAL